MSIQELTSFVKDAPSRDALMDYFERAAESLPKNVLHDLIIEYVSTLGGDPQIVMRALRNDNIIREALDTRITYLRNLK